MRVLYNNRIDNVRSVADVANRPVIRIGRADQNDLVLASPYVADYAAVLRRKQDRWEVEALGLNGCQVGEDEVFGGARCWLDEGQLISIYPYTIALESDGQSGRSDRRDELGSRLSDWICDAHVALLSRMHPSFGSDTPSRGNDEEVIQVERQLKDILALWGADGPRPLDAKRAQLVVHTAGCALRSELLSRLVAATGEEESELLKVPRGWTRFILATAEREQQVEASINFLRQALELTDGAPVDGISRVDAQFWPLWDRVSGEIDRGLMYYLTERYILKEVKDIIYGYGPLEDLLRLPAVTEIMVVNSDHIYIEKQGRLENTGRKFISDAVTIAIIERIVSRVGRRIDKSRPLVDARLSDGSRVNALIPPLAVSGPSITIRKFPERRLLTENLIERGSLTRTVAEFLRAAIMLKKNIIVSGGTGTGKTTLLNCLSDFIPDAHRIVTIEDTAELRLSKEHVVRIETKEANVEGAGAYSIRDLVRNALRMRPDRIVVGECRGGEALDMLQAMNTGHDGSMTTIHANSADDVILRLEVLVQMAADLPVQSIHRQIASGLDLIVQLARARDGSRSVVQVAEVNGIDPSTQRVRLKNLFVATPRGGALELCPTGCLPSFLDEMVERKLIDLGSFYL